MRKALEVIAAAILAALIMLAISAVTAHAQRVPAFPLNEKMVDEVYQCASQTEAIRFAEALTLSMDAARVVFKDATCGAMTAYYTYLQKVHQTKKLNVYEALWGSRKVYVITTWEHKRTESFNRKRKGGGHISPVRRTRA